MKKTYITPTIKGHKIITPHLLGSNSDGIAGDTSTSNESTGSETNQSKASYNRGSFFDDEESAQSATKERDFAYGL